MKVFLVSFVAMKWNVYFLERDTHYLVWDPWEPYQIVTFCYPHCLPKKQGKIIFWTVNVFSVKTHMVDIDQGLRE